MKALTIWQPWAALIITGAKPIEWRRHDRFRSSVGQRIVIHSGMRPVQKIEVADLILQCLREGRERIEGITPTHPTGLDIPRALELLGPLMTAPRSLPLGCGLGTAVLGQPRLAHELGYPVDSDREDNSNWGWPLTEIEPWPVPIAARGAQGLWDWPEPDFFGVDYAAPHGRESFHASR